MSEIDPQARIPEKKPAIGVGLVDRLYHNQFETVLKPDAYKDFIDAVSTFAAHYKDQGEGEFVLQLFFSETPEELNTPDFIHWFGIKYRLVTHEDGFDIETQGAFRPLDTSLELSEMPEFKDLPFHVISWSDIGWDQFDYNAGAHGQ